MGRGIILRPNFKIGQTVKIIKDTNHHNIKSSRVGQKAVVINHALPHTVWIKSLEDNKEMVWYKDGLKLLKQVETI